MTVYFVWLASACLTMLGKIDILTIHCNTKNMGMNLLAASRFQMSPSVHNKGKVS